MIEENGQRRAYGPVSPGDVPGILNGSVESLGAVEDIPFFARQSRLTFARCGVDRPSRPCRLRGPWRPVGPAPGDRARPRRHRCRGQGKAACAAVAARASRPASSGRRCKRRKARRSTSSATPTEGDSGTFADRMIMGRPLYPDRGDDHRRPRPWGRPRAMFLYPLGIPGRQSR